MSNVPVFERFQDAVDRRSGQVTHTGFDYKAGFYESFLKGLVETNPSIAAQVMSATKLLEEWAADQEIRDRLHMGVDA
jgi:hypothetical protein